MRIVLYLLALILVLPTVVRLVLTVLRALLGPARKPARAEAEGIPLRGELKRDPVCGTFVSTAVSVKKSVRGEVLHFCSTECRDKHNG
jgi:YHS domain-containing protein